MNLKMQKIQTTEYSILEAKEKFEEMYRRAVQKAGKLKKNWMKNPVKGKMIPHAHIVLLDLRMTQ